MAFDGYFWMMMAVYGGLVIVGYILASRQIKVVKAEEFKLADAAKALFFGVFFGSGSGLIVAMMIAVASGGQVPLAEFTQLDLWLILGFITIYPLIDLLYLAYAEKERGQTPYHTLLINKILSRFNKPKSYIVAVVLYIVIFLAPIFIIFAATGFDVSILSIIWISWVIGVPIILVTYYASRGFVSGITNSYFHIQAMDRSLFLGFENGSRVQEDFADNPGVRIVFGFMLFTYVWQFINLTQTLAYIATGKLTVNTSAFWVMALVVLFFGIAGFFTRFWGRKVKFTTVDLLLSSWIMMGIGADVLVNFLIANQNPLFASFATNPDGSLSFFAALVSGAKEAVGILPQALLGDHKFLAFAASVDKIVLILVITYYLISKTNPFSRNTMSAILARARETLDPVPLFNFIRTSYPEINKDAEKALVAVYGRLPKKKPHEFTLGHFMNPLMDAVCDPHPNTRRVGRLLFANIVRDAPEPMLRWVRQAMESPNYEKRLPAADALLNVVPPEIARQLDPLLVYTLVDDPNWKARAVGLKILSRFSELLPDLYDAARAVPAVDDGDYSVQAEALLALAHGNVRAGAMSVIAKMSHPNERVRRAAALAVAKIGLDKLDASAAPVLIEMMNDTRASSRIAAFDAIQKIGKISEFRIPVTPIIQALFDSDANVRNSATKAMLAVCETEPYKVDVDALINRLESSSASEKLAIIPILGKLWRDFPKKIMPLLFTSMEAGDSDMKSLCSTILKDIGKVEPLDVAQHLITMQETSGILTKGIISRTLIDIGKSQPEVVMHFLNEAVQSENQQTRLTAENVLDELGPAFPDWVEFSPLSIASSYGGDPKEKKLIAKLISEVIQRDPQRGALGIDLLVDGLSDEDASVRISVAKTLKILSENAPDIIPVQVVKDGLKDNDPLVREAMLKVLGNIAPRMPDQAMIIILDALGAEDWIIRNAAADSLGALAKAEASQKMVISNLVKRLSDEDKWVRYKVMLAISTMLEQNPEAVPLKTLLGLLNDNDEKVREATLKAIGKIGSKDFQAVHAKLTPFLADPESSVRDACVGAYFDMSSKVGISTLLPKMLMLLSDETDLETQRSVSQILRRVAKYEKEEIRVRIIKILRIRCEMSQDETICRVLSEFEQK